MDLGTIIGLLSGTAIIIIGILLSGGDLFWFTQFNALIIVLGGTLAATLVNLPIHAVGNLFAILKNVFTDEVYDYKTTIDEIVLKAEKARKNGLLSLETDLSSIQSVFLRNGLELAINEKESSRLRTFLNLEIDNIAVRHIAGQELFLYMGSYAPAFGMLGTVLGLIVMMNNFAGGGINELNISYSVADKFAELLKGMGTALITTFYGVFFANMVFLPIGGKLKRKSENELMLKNIVLEGIISIHAREHPILIREKLMTFVPRHRRFDSEDSVTEIKKSSSLSGIKDKLEERKEEEREEHKEETDGED